MQRINLKKIPRNKLPHLVKPMLATLVDEPFNRKGWLFEIKWDGFRAIADIKKGETLLYSRNLLSFNELFAPIVASLKKLKHDCRLDGEVVVLDKTGKSNFQLLQNYQTTKQGHLVYYVFDLLALDGKDLTHLPLIERKQLLKKLLPKLANVRYSDHVEEKGRAFFRMAEKQHLEGIVAKDGASIYRPGRRTEDWLKIKTSLRQEAVIGGFTAPLGGRKYFGSLILGVYEGDEFKYIGHSGGGFDQDTLKNIYGKLKPLIQTTPPFANPPKSKTKSTWVKPQYVCEVSFSEWTSEGQMRHPVFLGLRPDKKAADVVREVPQEKNSNSKAPKKDDTTIIGGQQLKLTHLDKVYWPKEKITKGDLVEYYRKIAPYILPYLKDRPESMHRHPNGITGQSFFQKDVDHQPPNWVKTVLVPSESKGKINYLVCQDEATLIYMANLGCIEINPWSSRVGKLDHPDFLVIDLDPEAISFNKVVLVAQSVHKLLDKIGIPNFCKTSGATGLHIYVPLGSKYTYDQAKDFARLVATMVNQKLPDITSIERMPKKRQHKVYLDFLQNRKGQTLAAPYSVRPKPGATVSTPLDWSEVRLGLDPKKFTIKTIFERLEKKKDLFKPVFGKGADLNSALKKLDRLA